jgi:cytochrome c-type biogenesis protein CcmI
MSIWIPALLIVAAVAMFVAAPLAEGLFERRLETGDTEIQRLEHQRSLALQGLRELEFDHQMGKLDPDDYRNLRSVLESRALSAMSSLERGQGHLGSQARSTAAAVNPLWSDITYSGFCPKCATRVEGAQKFCVECGALLAVYAKRE